MSTKARLSPVSRIITILLVALLAFVAVTPARADTVTFNTSGTWVAPAGVTSVTVEVWGGGGKGGTRSSNGGGGGGGGGAYSLATIAVTPGNSYPYVVGAGATTTSPGGDSYFLNTSTVLAKGGGSVANDTTTGAAGGAATSGVGTTKYSGGTGANAPGAGGGGGSSAGTGANGGNGSGSTGGTAPAGGGNGGNGRSGSQGDGSDGTAPGGGGGGAYRTSSNTRNGGDGAAGRVRITYTLPSFTITVTQGAGGTITPGTTSVISGGSQTFDIDPNDGFVVGDVVVGPPSSSAGRTNSFTFSNVQSDKTITASFESGWRWPTTYTDSGGTAWGTQTGGYHSDNSRATSPYFFLIPLSGSIDYGTFNIPAIPANSTIDGIEVALEGSTTASNISVSLFNGVAFGTSQQTGFVPNNSEETQILGGPTFKWGSTWTIDSFTNANFKLRLAAGQNAGFSADQVQVKVYYTLPPLTVTINQKTTAPAQADPTNTAPINFTVVFSQPVSNFLQSDPADVVLSGTAGATTYAITGSGTTYNVAVSGMAGTGDVIASIPAGVASDTNGTLNNASTSDDHTVYYDATPPTATIDLQDASDTGISNTDDLTNAASPVFDVTFSEAVSGLGNGDFLNVGTATGCSYSLGTPTGNTYPVTVSGCSEGTLILQVAAGGVNDSVGNPNALIGGLTVTIDRTRPTVTVDKAVGQADPTNLSPINFTAVFSEPVFDFADADVALSGSATSGATIATVAQVTPPNDGTTYNLAVSNMATVGDVTANINAGVATDAAGNTNFASTSPVPMDNTVQYDTAAPIATIDLQPTSDSGVSNADNITNAASPIFNVGFNKTVTGLAAGDFTNAGTATCTTYTVNGSGSTYTVTVSGCSEGTLKLQLAAGAVRDTANNPNAQTTGPEVTLDRTGPTVTINQKASAPAQADPTNATPIHFIAEFSEPAYNFATGDVVFTGSTAGGTLIGTVTEVAPNDGTTYNVAVSGMTSDGNVIASINASVATDAAGNNNAASTSGDHTVTYDTLRPTVSINQKTTAPAQADPTNASPINFTVVFTEPVTGFGSEDVNLAGDAGATIATITGSGTTYNVAVSGMVDDGQVIATVLAGGAKDAAGNTNLASTSGDNIVIYDTLRPTVTIDQKTSAPAQADPTNASPINFTVVFSEPVTGFTNTDVKVIGTAGATTVVVTPISTTTYTVAVSGMTQSGTVTASILVNAAQDLAGNSSYVSTSGDNTVYYDNGAPTVTINQDAAQADPTGASPINFAVVFSETMNSATFTGADIALSGTATGTLTVAVTGSGTTYNVAVSGMTGSGTVIADVKAGSVQDLAGNSNTASTSNDNIVTFDNTRPTVTVNQAAGQNDPTNSSSINFTVVFTESVTGFTSVSTAGSTAPGTLVATITGGPSTYNVAISGMTGPGTVVVTIPANAATDPSGNGNTASTSSDNTVTYDNVRPTVTINQAAGQADPTGASPINFTVVFSESVTGFDSADIALNGTAGASNVAISGGPSTYTVAVSGMTNAGTVIATVNAGGAFDAAGNSNLASASTDNQVTFDNNVFSVTVNQATGQADPTNTGPIHFTVVFNKPVIAGDFTASDVVVSGTAGGTKTVTVTEIAPMDRTTYDVAVSGMTGSGTVIATIPANAAHDSANNGNANSSSTDNTVTYDITPPTVTINQAGGQADPTNTGPINFTVVFSERVTGFATGDVSFTGSTVGGTLIGAVTEIAPNNGTTYNVAVSGMTGNGTVVASLLAGVATDTAGNLSAASTSTDNIVAFDNAGLGVTINQKTSAPAQADPTNAAPINFTVIFSKVVTDFTSGDVSLSAPAGATASVTGSGTTYNVAVSGMTASGTVTASILAGVAHDASGNPNSASASTDNTVTYDITLPTVTINQATGQADPTNTGPINFTVVFSEPINESTFIGTDVSLSGAPGALTATVSLVSGNTYNVAVTGMTGSGTVVATIPAGRVQDVAGNSNTASISTDNSVRYDVTAPTVTINQASGQADPTNTGPINFTVVFSETVTGFAAGDVSFTGSTVGGTLIGAVTEIAPNNGTTYNVAVSGMTGNGTVVASLLAGVAKDTAGNDNAASTSTDNTVTYDSTGLGVTINQAGTQADPTNAAPIDFTVVFTKPVTGFSSAGVSLSAPAGSTVTVLGASGGTTYTVRVTGMTGSGTVIASVLAGAAHDASGTSNTASTSTDNSVTYDITLPTVTINQATGQLDPTNTGPINFTVVFSEPINASTFTGADVSLTGGTAPGALTATVTPVSGNTYNVAVSGMTGSGRVVATILAGGVKDLAGNNNTASTSTDNSVTYDITRPTVTINQASSQLDPTNASPINFTVVFSKPVTGFATGDVTFAGTAGGPLTGTITEIAPLNGTTYNVGVTGMTSSGTVIASILAGVATDALANTNVASTSSDNQVTFDNSILGVTINQATGQNDPTNIGPINFTAIFNKPVSDFATGDVTVSGTAGANTATVTGSGTTYNVAVSGMFRSGTVVVTIAAGVAHDVSNNGNTPGTFTDNQVIYDITIPTVTINQATSQGDPTNASPINFTVIFSEPVIGFAGAAVALDGTAGATTATVSLVSGNTYNVAVSGMSASGTVIASIPAGNVQDAAGNGNANSTSGDNTVTYDFTPTPVTINQAATQADPTNTSPINFTVVFSKSVTGFTGEDVALSGTAAATTAVVTGSGAAYTVAVSGMTGDGTVIASIPAGGATDALGNVNAASTSTDNVVTYDTTGPTVTINQAAGQPDPTGISPINFAVVFSEPVTGFTGADLNLGGSTGATTAVATGSGTTYNVAVSGMTSSGTLFVAVTDAAGTDVAGNPSQASTSTDNTVRYDMGAPSVTINQAVGQADPTNTGPINFTAVFSKPVTGFTSADVVLTGTTGATTAVVTGSGTTYNVVVSGMTDTGTVIATIPADRARDLAGNGNLASTSTDNTVIYDNAPVCSDLTLSADEDTPSQVAPICTDVDGNSLTYSIVTQPSSGSASVVAGNLSFSPAFNFNGADSFTYRANDGFLDSAPATVSVSVAAFNDAPTDIILSASIVEDGSPAGTLVGYLSTIDPDAGDTHTYSLLDSATYPDNDSFQISGNQLQTLGVFNIAVKSSYTINIQTDDGLGGTFAQPFIIIVVPAKIPSKVVTFKSMGAYDGWVLESFETSNMGGSLNADATTFNLGDDAARKQYRAILHFDTSRLPDKAIITKVTLKIKKQGLIGTNPFRTHGNILVNIREGAFSNDSVLQLSDFQSIFLATRGIIVNKPVRNWYSTNLPSTTFRFINATGTTQFRLYFMLGDDNDKRADYMKFYSGNAGAANRPKLIIEYYVP